MSRAARAEVPAVAGCHRTTAALNGVGSACLGRYHLRHRAVVGARPPLRILRKIDLLTDALLFAAYTATSVIGLLLLKHALPLVRIDWQSGFPFTASMLILGLGACLYVASFALWLFILARNELSSAYPMAIGLTLAFSTVGAALFLAESLNVLRLAGIALIFLGIFLVARY